MKRPVPFLSSLLFLLLPGTTRAGSSPWWVLPPLIPRPSRMEKRVGRFRITKETRLYTCPQGKFAAEFLASGIRKWKKVSLQPEPYKQGSPRAGSISLSLVVTDWLLGPEGYILCSSPETVSILANDPKGLFYGAVTLLQMVLTSPPGKSIPIHCLYIQDRPRFRWRGLMLDCSRTFQSVDYIKKTMDRMAFYKMNVLHLHLTDDQGWRLEIEKYPELTAKGARFPKKYKEPPSHQGYYTQAEIRELVQYASKRNITILPEIEMPGHSLAALSCRPELSCTGGPLKKG